MYSVVLLLQVGGRLLSNQSNFHYGFAFSIGDIWSHIPELWCNVRHISQKDWDIASASACSTPSRVQCTLRAKFTHSKASDAKYSSAQSITSTYSIFFPCFWNKELLLRKFELQRSALVIEVLWKRVDNMLKNVTGIGARIACVHQTRWNSISGSAPKWPWSISLGLNGAEEKSHKRRARMPICGFALQEGIAPYFPKTQNAGNSKTGCATIHFVVCVSLPHWPPNHILTMRLSPIECKKLVVVDGGWLDTQFQTMSHICSGSVQILYNSQST